MFMKTPSKTRFRSTFVLGTAVFGLVGCSGNDGADLPGSGGSTATVGGASNGGSVASSGGSSSKGGTTTIGNGGTTSAIGGATLQGGTQNSTGGTSTGGVANVGGASKGGTLNGGTSSGNGGAATGGASKGGTPSTGGAATGGASKGGTPSTGGAATGGASKGGTPSTGGAATGGAATGGAATGGAATGGSSSNEIWISPTGSDSNPGTQAQPMFTLCDTTAAKGACYKLCPGGTNCAAGGTIWVMGGTYNYTATQKTTSSFVGTSTAMMKIYAVAGATPVFNFSSMATASTARGLQIGGNYWHVKGITVTNAGDTGIFVMGSNNIIEQCVAHHNRDAGIVIGVNSSAAGSGQNNLILNCDSYLNNDVATKGENADGFGMKENAGTGNVFRGCRAWDNADDGWDLYAWASPVTIDNCWAISQGETTNGSSSDGNGFKLGGDGVSAAHKLSGLYATNNKYGTSGRGFTNNSNPATMSCSNCASWGNKAGDTGVGGVSTTAPTGATAAKMIAAKRNADGSLPAITSL